MPVSHILIGGATNATVYVNKLHPETGRRGLGSLPAQERWNLQLVVVRGVLHRNMPAMRIAPLIRRPLGVLGDRVGRE